MLEIFVFFLFPISVIKMISAPKLKCYFDVACPNSWLTLQALKANLSLFSHIEYEPVCDFKIGILHNAKIWNQRKKGYNSRIWKTKKNNANKSLEESEGILRRIDERGKRINSVHLFEPPEDWEATYKKAITHGSVVSQLYLTSIKERIPDIYESAIHHIGTRLWVSKQPVHYGCHMSTVSRELGIPFKISEDIVSRLSSPENRTVLHQNCKTAVELELTEAPGLVVITKNGEKKTFRNVAELFKSLSANDNDQKRNIDSEQFSVLN